MNFITKRRFLAAGFIVAAIAFGCVLLSSSPSVSARTQPMPGVPERFGIAMALVDQNIAELPAIRAAGAELVRTDMFWEGVEPVPGKYDWRRDDTVFRELKRAGLRPYIILAYGNRGYSGDMEVQIDGRSRVRALPPTTPEARQAFARFAAAAVERYKAYHPIWEIWNEPDIPHFWAPEPNPIAYGTLASETCAAMRKVDPAAVIVGPAAAHVPTLTQPNPPLLEELQKSGALKCFNALSVHPYYLNEKRLFLHAWIWENIKRYTSDAGIPNKRLGLIAGEWGVSSNGIEADEFSQAKMLTKTHLLNLSEGVNLTVWYNWQNIGDDPKDREHNFGLLRRDGTAKPALEAYHTLTKQISSKTFRCKIKSTVNDVVLLFSDSQTGDVTLSIWNDSFSHDLQVSALKSAFKMDQVSYRGAKITSVPLLTKIIKVRSTSTPLYIDIPAMPSDQIDALCAN